MTSHAELAERWKRAAADAGQAARLTCFGRSVAEMRESKTLGVYRVHEAREFVLSMAAMLVLTPSHAPTSIAALAHGIAAVCAHEPVEGRAWPYRCACEAARQLVTELVREVDGAT